MAFLMRKVFVMIKYVCGLLLVFISACTGCTQDISNLSLFEQATLHKDRFKGDKSRDKQRRPAEILAFSGVAPELVVIDLLGGGGYYTELLSYIVGEHGKVYIQNNSLFLRFSAEELEKRLSGDRLRNVIRLDSEFADMQLPEGVDLIMMGLNYHDIYVSREDPVIMAKREEFFPQLINSLKQKCKYPEISNGFQYAAVDIKAVTHGLESIKGDPYRKNNIE